jgi:hypothetical protein
LTSLAIAWGYIEKKSTTALTRQGGRKLQNCLNKKDFKRSTLLGTLEDTALAMEYETIGDMIYSEFQLTGSARAVERKIGFGRDLIIKYLRILGVRFDEPLNRHNRRFISSLYRRGLSGNQCARAINRHPTTTRRALLRDLGRTEYNRLTEPHKRNRKG